jgi:ribose transport system ATP-binding protein
VSEPVLSVEGAQKSFGGVTALAGVSLDIGKGEIHALLGENGAGKSTFIKVLAGVVSPDAGHFRVGGKSLGAQFSPKGVAEAGVRFVHQDLGLIDTMSVMENIALVTGFEKAAGFINYRSTVRRVQELLEKIGLAVSPRTLIGKLPQAERAIVALVRAMQRDAKLIVLDEVTASLPTPDVARVHEAVRAAQDIGISFLYVSHRLEEVFDLCDRLTVLRDGRTIASSSVKDVDRSQVIAWIVGKTLSPEDHVRPTNATGDIRLNVSGLSGKDLTRPIDFNLRAGEILGVTGIIGSGYHTICEYLCGLGLPDAGGISIDGNAIRSGSTIRMRAAGCEAIVGDRTLGAFPDRKVRENIFAGSIGRNGVWPNLRDERQKVEELTREYRVRPGNCSEMTIQKLSGGNQQKVLFARSLRQRPNLLVLIDPTAGVDVGARRELHNMLKAAAEYGTAIVFGSSDFEEVASIAHRTLVIKDGGLGAELSGSDITWERMFAEAHGGERHVGKHVMADGEGSK